MSSLQWSQLRRKNPFVQLENWEGIELTVDSGAAETLCPQTVAPTVPTTPKTNFRQGVHYIHAGGKRISKLGEIMRTMSSNDGGRPHGLTLRVAEVNRALLSAST